MAEFDLNQNPLANAKSLLQDARQTNRRQKRDDTKSMLFKLAGQVVGGVLQGRQVDKFNTFMNKENVLSERAVVRSAVDNAQKVAERAKTAISYAGGKEAFFNDELVQTYKAS